MPIIIQKTIINKTSSTLSLVNPFSNKATNTAIVTTKAAIIDFKTLFNLDDILFCHNNPFEREPTIIPANCQLLLYKLLSMC